MLISTAGALEKLVAQLLEEEAVALDTEFHGEKRYWPDLYLIQLSGMNGPVAVDPLKIQDLSPLAQLLESESTVKVMHSARNDIDILMHHIGVRFTSVFDTQLAAAFLGFDRQPSLSKLVKMECGVTPKKGHTLSDWSLRPLEQEQLTYALDDVRYLLRIYRNQVERLTESGRLDWYRQEAGYLTDPATYRNSLERQFKKIRSRSKIRTNRLNVLWALVKWRDSAARHVNKPRNFIARDHVLGALAAMAPDSKKKVSRIRGLSESFISSWGDGVVEVVEKALSSTGEDYPDIPRHHSRPGVSARKDILRIFLKQESARLGISPQLLLSKDLIQALSKNPPRTESELYTIPELSGWRKEALGEELICLLNGNLALRLNSCEQSGLDFIRLDR
jgi:ribonuclease D